MDMHLCLHITHPDQNRINRVHQRVICITTEKDNSVEIIHWYCNMMKHYAPFFNLASSGNAQAN